MALEVDGCLLGANPAPAGAKLVDFGPLPAELCSGLGEPACQLTVLRAGEWAGFRLHGSDRLLQGKRKGSSRFAFFSTHFGVAEQWVLAPEPPPGWERHPVRIPPPSPDFSLPSSIRSLAEVRNYVAGQGEG